MNKFTSTLAGLALVAGASIAPAFAQGTFTVSPAGQFSFTDGVGGITTQAIPVLFNSSAPGGVNSTGFLTLTGGSLAAFSNPIGLPSGTFLGVTETFTPNAGQTLGAFSDTGTVFVSQRSATQFDLASDPTTFAASGTNFDLVPGVVPEASTTVSFGVLLALGGLAVVLRRKGVKNAA